MPLIIKRNVLKVKEPGSSTYRGIDAVTDETAAQKVAQINAAGAEQIQAIEDKGDEVAGSLRESIVSASASAVAPSQGAAASYDNATGALQIDVPRGPGPVSISDGVDQPDGRTKYTMTFEGVGSQPGATFDFYVKNGISLEDVYPVGALYISTVATNPGQLFSFGTWERITDKFLLASGPTYAAGSTGGAATHTLTEEELPEHSHGLVAEGGVGLMSWPVPGTAEEHAAADWGTSKSPAVTMVSATEDTGSGSAFSVLPPYLAVYVWRRTA